MIWRAIVPLRITQAKSRLSAVLDGDQRQALALRMARHVLTIVSEIVPDITLLSPTQPDLPGRWVRDIGRGLNEELAAAAGQGPLLILHADLPFLTAGDIQRLIDEATTHGRAIAPDRHGRGTNGLALIEASGLQPAFGPDSFALHRRLLPHAAIVKTEGLSFDIDEPGCLAEATARGWSIGLSSQSA